MKGTIKYIFLSVLLTGCFLSEDVPPDQDVWEYSLPSQQGMSDGLLLELDENISDTLFGNIGGLVVIRNDHLVFENYYNRAGRRTLFTIGRMGSGLVAALFGEVLNNQLANQLDLPIADFFPEYAAIFDATPEKRNITIRHLLNMTDGLAWNESFITIDDPNSNLAQMLNADDFVEFVLSRPLEAPPGIRFSFNTGNGILLLNLMDRLLDQPLEDFFQSRLFGPLGITDFEVSNMPNGLPNYVNGLLLNTLDMTKVGYLLLQDGVWRGSQLIDEAWLSTIMSTQVPLDQNQDFGFHWWRFNGTSFIFDRYQIDDFYFTFGERGQSMYLSRDANMVITVSNSVDPSRNFATAGFFAFTRILDSLFN